MSSKRVVFIWLASIILLAIFAGLSWLNLELSPEAGGQEFEITGYQVFPVISALLLLQLAAVLASFLTPITVARSISGLLAPIMLAHALFVAIGLQSNLQNAVEAQITEITGVA
ncbi:MAG: Trp biosynthesis-associated membrane protein, partial [Micrococcales bacterium]|nr:Trp biosynthesis-associated membrane protein [Micrococcales bacterium]